jgi:Holliday junction resolvase RusA-like endonuclease
MLAFSVPGEAVPWARAGSNGKVRFTKPNQANFMAAVKMFAQAAMKKAGYLPFDGPLEMQVRAVYVAPKSWSAKKRDAALWKHSRPDADNLAKLVGDSLNGIAFADDAQVADLRVQKVYGLQAELIVSIMPLAGRVHGE